MAEPRDSPAPSDSSSSSSDESERPLDLTADDGWEDAEPDEENLEFVSLVDEKVFGSIKEMLEYCKQEREFDLADIVTRLGGWVLEPFCSLGACCLSIRRCPVLTCGLRVLS